MLNFVGKTVVSSKFIFSPCGHPENAIRFRDDPACEIANVVTEHHVCALHIIFYTQIDTSPDVYKFTLPTVGRR